MPTLASRFELPALNLNFGSITDGTDIPPPPDSPVLKVPTPPQTPPPAEENNKKVVKQVNEESKPASTNGNLAGTKRSAEDAVPLSPAASSRQGSIRRLFSRSTLNNSYVEGQLQSNGSLTVVNGARPSSQSGSSFMDDRKSKRTSGWFRRIRTGDSSSKRASTVFEAAPPTPTFNKKPSGPPPPMIPEMADLEKDEGSLGADLFKNIK
ncbi:hypothetical protein BGZ61DRAFT_185780 [Ilyonectria robusta]|uniref:uncharacterized protein n=1 Tax=Ilyonectria robusta TaxID=1079257 RepID=UPI001E8CB4A3|nr:uncharacterized protein BGZ61DRAFT_185780 [Ilyonectria robusta]KAH8729663.1 hypothetical protein BGZ61DRAFT_185780 [Ilyonectria robusta]